jgi:glycosyltransferase involved in cell wall biosynthesis
MSNPSISIITMVYNGMPYLKECIESILAQDYQDWELLISDDGSTDGSRAYLDTLSDSRIRLFKQTDNLGIFGNLNFLFRQAKAEISQILCQDDYFVAKDSLSQIVRYWETASPSIGFVCFNHQYNSKGHIINLGTSTIPSVIKPPQADLWFFVFGNFPGNLSNISLRTHIVAELGYFNRGLPFAGDFEFWSRAARKYDMGVQKELVVYVRRHANVASNFLSKKGELYAQHIPIYEQLIERLSSSFEPKDLVAYFNYDICSFHYRTAIKSAIHGQFAYLKKFVSTKSSIDWPKWMQLIVCFPFAIFNGNQRLTVNMAKKFMAAQTN